MKNQILTENNKIILQTTDYKKVSAIPIGTGALINYAVVGRIADFCFFITSVWTQKKHLSHQLKM